MLCFLNVHWPTLSALKDVKKPDPCLGPFKMGLAETNIENCLLTEVAAWGSMKKAW
jgi:hypothetical protein